MDIKNKSFQEKLQDLQRKELRVVPTVDVHYKGFVRPPSADYIYMHGFETIDVRTREILDEPLPVIGANDPNREVICSSGRIPRISGFARVPRTPSNIKMLEDHPELWEVLQEDAMTPVECFRRRNYDEEAVEDVSSILAKAKPIEKPTSAPPKLNPQPTKPVIKKQEDIESLL